MTKIKVGQSPWLKERYFCHKKTRRFSLFESDGTEFEQQIILNLLMQDKKILN